MRLTLSGARVIDPRSGQDGVLDVHIAGGKIAGLGELSNFQADRCLDLTGKLLLPGLVDIGAHLRDPGPRYKGSLVSESAAALRGGYTCIAPRPDTSPVLDSAAHIQTLLDRVEELGTLHVAPIGALTQGLEGQLLANMAGLKKAGCVALTNLRRPVADTRILKRCLEYAASFDIPVILHPQDAALAAGGCAHEGTQATRLGLGGISETAETAALAQWLLLIERSGVRAHLAHLSCGRSLAMVEEAKVRGIALTCDVTLAQLHWTDEAIDGFDANFHLEPPLRSVEDRQALRDGLKRGAIEAIASGHLPHEQAAKMAPFAASEPGMSTLETAWAMAQALVKQDVVDWRTLAARLSSGPADILGVSGGGLAVGDSADIAVFDPTQEWEPSSQSLHSSGLNTPLLNRRIRGRCVLTLIEGKICYQLDA
ncbi:dihydroorotase [Pistricoccus aurantiacus]|uniref:dihydroorotase n=1 Tax=Pistricoccus aurantiacus TaxID=1883414 RepID=UPI0036305435